jgi:two-component system chemotaxis response regulator CheY
MIHMPKTVIVVDDITFVRKTISEILTEAHYEVVGEAADGKEAVDLYMKLRPDLITLDLVMPKVTGIEAARQIIRQNSDAKIIMISAMGQENLIVEAINAGVKDYILKPFTAQEILRSIDRVLNLDEHAHASKSRTV